MIRIERFSDGKDLDDRHWDGRWAGWDASAIDAAVVWEGMLPAMRRFFPAGARLLEAGCGTGKYCVALRQQGYRMVGLDYSKTGLDVLERIAPGIPAVHGSVLRMPFADGEFDGALSLGVVEHFEEGPEVALAELSRVIRRGGRLFLTVPLQNMLWDVHLKRTESAAPPTRRSDDRTPDLRAVAAGGKERAKVFYQYLHRRDEMADHLRRAGFRPRAVRYFGRRHGLDEYMKGLQTVVEPPHGPEGNAHPAEGTGLRATLKRRFPKALRAVRAAQLGLVERALPGPICAHTIAFLVEKT